MHILVLLQRGPFPHELLSYSNSSASEWPGEAKCSGSFWLHGASFVKHNGGELHLSPLRGGGYSRQPGLLQALLLSIVSWPRTLLTCQSCSFMCSLLCLSMVPRGGGLTTSVLIQLAQSSDWWSLFESVKMILTSSFSS